jgi:hypothetical protein
MDSYFFQGVVYPERAQLSLNAPLQYVSTKSGKSYEIRINILLNQVAVWMPTDEDWELFDLRNLVLYILRTHLSYVGYLTGFAYEVAITRAIHREKGIDYVFGIDIPILAERDRNVDVNAAIVKLMSLGADEHGVFLHRCMNDLVAAMKNAEDTAFYCYRAIESLRHHCAVRHGLKESRKTDQWRKFREITQMDEKPLRELEIAARGVRHGEPTRLTSDARGKILSTTWDIVDAYVGGV